MGQNKPVGQNRIIASERLFHVCHNTLPFHVQVVQGGLLSLSLEEKYSWGDHLEIRVRGEDIPAQTGILITYTQTATCMAAVSARLLLEFLGLKRAGTPSAPWQQPVRRRPDDIGIENYRQPGLDGQPFSTVSPSVVSEFPNPGEVERAWITVCDFAGQRLAHLTDDTKLDGADVTPMLRVAFETIPKLVDHKFLSLMVNGRT